MPKLLDLPEGSSLLKGRRAFGFHEDFFEFVTGDLGTSLAADVGSSVAAGDAAGGVLVITTGATDNNEAAWKTTKELFKVADGKPLVAEARLQYAEAATNAANVLFGFMDAIGADAVLDNGAGPKASYSGAVFFKVDGGTRWNVEVSIAGTQSTVELTAANSLDKVAKTAGGASYVVLRIEIVPKSSTQADVLFFIDDVLVYKFTDWTYTNATEMQAGVVAKAGGATSEVVNVDYVDGWQLR